MKLNLRNVEFSYASVPVLEDICLNIEDAQLVSIIGPNGVGKSTLIHCMNNILTPGKGTVLIDDTEVVNIGVKELAKQIGYVPYSAHNSFPLSVVDTVLMGRHPHNSWKTTKRDLQIVYETLGLLEIEHLAMRPFNELSAGQHQKVMLARGIAQEPKILLLDEPTANLDIRHQMEATRTLKELVDSRDMLIVMISHDLNLASTYSDNVIMMHEGRIFAVGTPSEVISEENLRMVYGVDSDIVDVKGRPHVILLDDKFDPKSYGEVKGHLSKGAS